MEFERPTLIRREEDSKVQLAEMRLGEIKHITRPLMHEIWVAIRVTDKAPLIMDFVSHNPKYVSAAQGNLRIRN